MKNLKSRIFTTKKVAILFFVLSVCIIGINYYISHMIFFQIEKTNFKTEIKDNTKENLVTVRNLIDTMVEDLEHTVEEVKRFESIENPEIEKILKFSHQLNSFDVTFISDTEGNAYDYSGQQFKIGNQEFFKEAMKGDVVFSEILPSKRFEAIQIISYPIYSASNEKIGAVFGLFAIETLTELIYNVVDYDEHIYIIDSNGQYINCFDEDFALSGQKNFWEDLKLRKIDEEMLSKVKNRFSERKEGDFSYRHENGRRYGYHMPVDIKDWQLVLTVEESKMNSHISSIRKIDNAEVIVNFSCIIVMVLCIYLYLKNTNKEIQIMNRKITKNNELLRMAVESSDYVIFEYDINDKKIELKTHVPNQIFNSQVITAVPECFLSADFVSKDGYSAVKNMFATIETEKSCQADIQINTPSQEKNWYRVSMHNIYNNKGDIIGTVGTVENITKLKAAEAAIKSKEELHNTLISNALLYAKVDLSTGTILELNNEEVQIPYEEFMHNNILKFVTEQHYYYVSQQLSLGSLNDEYLNGKEYIEVQCLMKNDNGTKWVTFLVYRIHKSDTSKVVFVIRDIDDKKKKEIALKKQAERDGLTDLYNAVTTRKKIDKILCDLHLSDENYVFILFDLDNFKQVNDTFGHAFGDSVLVDVANILTKHLRSSDIIGRLGGDEFVILLSNMRSEVVIDKIISQLNDFLIKTYTKGDLSVEISASIGFAIAPRDGLTYNELFQKADIALYRVKKEGKKGFKKFE